MNLVVIAFILVVVSVCGCGGTSTVSYVPTSGTTVLSFSDFMVPRKGLAPLNDDVESKQVKRSVYLYPSELYFGDTLYMAEILENTSDLPVSDIVRFKPKIWEMRNVTVSISSKNIERKYNWRFENPTDVFCLRRMSSCSPLGVGKKFCSKFIYVDIGPLEDYEHPFWKELREKLTPEGIVCTILIEYNRDAPNGVTATQEILVKPRPSDEMALLKKWYKNTPKELFPFNYEGELPNSGKSNIRLSSFSIKSYDPWLFMRVGNRKPSDPNNPQTLKGWRNLEASLIPSTMRDEVRLARFRLEYFAARDADEANKIKKDYWDWLDSLPEVQRTVMENYPYFSSSSEKDAGVWRKLADLRRK